VDSGGNITTGYPLYDAHGNMVATLHRSGMGSFGLSDSRSYDAWGSIRLGAGTGDPKHAYCASLGHVKDDESGLTYMRARYYESSTGRFISQDPGRQGGNWFAYCGNNPVDHIDTDGKDWIDVILAVEAGLCAALTCVALGGGELKSEIAFAKAFITSILATIVSTYSEKATEGLALDGIWAGLGGKAALGGLSNVAATLAVDLITGDKPGGDVLLACFGGGGDTALASMGADAERGVAGFDYGVFGGILSASGG
jgi:RHS repeat-associated protein